MALINAPATYTLFRGNLFAKSWIAGQASTAGFVHLGNFQSFKLQNEQDEVSHTEQMSGMDLEDASYYARTKTKYSGEMESFNRYNLALFMQGNITTIAGGTTTDENVGKAVAGENLYLSRSALTAFTALKQGSTTIAPADYEVDLEGGMIRLKTTATITANVDFLATYTFGTQSTITAGASAPRQLSLLWIGKNQLQANSVARCYIPKASIKMLSEINLISNNTEADKATVEGKCLLDQGQTGTFIYTPVIGAG